MYHQYNLIIIFTITLTQYYPSIIYRQTKPLAYPFRKAATWILRWHQLICVW